MSGDFLPLAEDCVRPMPSGAFWVDIRWRGKELQAECPTYEAALGLARSCIAKAWRERGGEL